MKRSTIRNLGRFVPGSLRERAKRHFLERSIDTVQTRFALEESPTAIVCRIDDATSFSAPIACKNDLAHYTTSFEGRAEFAALFEAASGPGGVLFDIGAHCGLISTLWCAAKPGNRVFSFEPSPALVERVAGIRDLNQFEDRMNVNQVGIGESNGTAEMLMDPVGGFVQSRHFENTMWSAPESIEVAIESIESASIRLGIIPNFIKMDIEGYEYEAIQGAASFLSQHRPALFLELHLNYLEERKLSPKTVVELLQQCGYSFFTYAGTQLKADDVYGTPLGICHVVAK
ncbi:MAG TPA: FkbM family methyltransferase [Chthoniobacterales bacterium]|nr:FkbM family methyltransferase [Chthoniobacterales bacterium]